MANVRSIRRADFRDFRFQARKIRRAIEASSRAEGDPILGIESDHRYFGVEVAANHLKNAFQHTGIEEESRPKVETEPILFEGGTTSANARQPFHDVNSHTSFCQQKCCREPARTCSDHQHLRWRFAG